jgi:YHS domain-containing protein
MSLKRKTIALILVSIALIGLLTLFGCKKKETPPQPPTETDMTSMTEEKDMPAKTEVVETIAQKTCPITGKPIDKSVFVEYNGQKVYFCCPECKAEFAKDPDKYIANLPQFQE